MKKLSFLLCVFFISFLSFLSSRAESPVQTLSDYLIQSQFKGELCWWKQNERLIQFDQGLNCYMARHNYLWYKNRLTIQLDGSGRLFQVSAKDTVVRLDNTCYEGYNFEAFHFVFHDTLFSLGGYGYWQFNSQLRFFDEKTGEWSSMATNKNIPIRIALFSQAYLDSANHKVYVTYVEPETVSDETGKKEKSKIYVQCLDLYTKKWWEHEKPFLLQDYLQLDALLLRNIAIHFRQYSMTIFQNETYLLDYKLNRAYKLTPAIHDEIISLLGTLTKWLIIPESSGITFFNPENAQRYRVNIPDASLIPIPGKVYAEDSPAGMVSYFTEATPLLSTSIFSAVILLMLFHIRSLRSKLKSVPLKGNPDRAEDNQQHREVDLSKPVFRENLTELENALLDLLIANSANDQNTTVTQINHTIGVAKKDTRIQNNIRAATLLMINRKFMAYSGIKEDLIQKERTEFDKRFFEYFIPKKYISKIK